jgi:hypothetical protein
MKRLIEKIVFCGLVTLARGREGDDGGRRATALGVLDHGRLAALQHGHARVRRAEIDADCLSHLCAPFFR